MKTYEAMIKGLTALLINRFSEKSEQPTPVRGMLVNNDTPREQAERATYKDTGGRFYFRGAAISKLMREAGANHKLKGNRRAAKFVVPAATVVTEDAILITNGDGKTLVKDFEVDSRPVVIPSTKGRIMRHRPRFDQWSASFHIRINENLLPPEFIHQLLTEGGIQLGVGDYRPEKGGPFGTFEVNSWKEIK